MTHAVRLVRACDLERLAIDLHTLAFEAAEPSRCSVRAERLIAEAERIAAAVRAQFRG